MATTNAFDLLGSESEEEEMVMKEEPVKEKKAPLTVPETSKLIWCRECASDGKRSLFSRKHTLNVHKTLIHGHCVHTWCREKFHDKVDLCSHLVGKHRWSMTDARKKLKMPIVVRSRGFSVPTAPKVNAMAILLRREQEKHQHDQETKKMVTRMHKKEETAVVVTVIDEGKKKGGKGGKGKKKGGKGKKKGRGRR